MTTTQVDIIARDQTARAFASVDTRISGLQGSVGRLTGLFAGLTAGVSLVGGARTIRGVIQLQDELAKLSQATGVGIESLAGLEFATSQTGTSLDRASRGIKQFSTIVLEANGGTDRYSTLIKALGLDLERLKNATPEEQFIQLAGAISENVREQERAAVVTALLGNRYTELIPLLAQGETGLRDMIQRGKELNPVTAESAAQAELFNDSLDELNRQVKVIGVNLANNMIPALTEVAQVMNETSKQSGFLVGAFEATKTAARRLYESDLFIGAVGLSGPVGTLIKARVEARRLEEQLEDVEEEADDTAEALREIKIPDPVDTRRSFSRILQGLKESSTTAASSTQQATKALTDQGGAAQATARRVAQLNRQYDPLIQKNEDLAEVAALAQAGLSKVAVDNAKIKILEDYARATEKVIVETEDLSRQTVQVFDTNEQLIISSIRRTQGALADGLFNFFDDGLSGMVRSVKNAVGRIVAEFASVKILQSTGIAGLFGLGSTTALAAGGSGGGAGALNLLSAGSGLLNFVNTGAGSLLSSAAGALGFSNFAAGASGAASAGVFGAGGIPFLAGGPGAAGTAAGVVGASGGAAAGLGASLASFAGPVAIAAAVDVGLRSIFGDKKIGGTAGDVLNFVPVIGTLINGLFGRGAPKFRGEELLGNVTTSGFSGVSNTRFRESGGAFRSNRTSNFIVDTDSGQLLNAFGRLSESGNFPKGLANTVVDPATKRALEIGDLLDQTFQALGATLENTADILGVSTTGLENFSAELDLISEKGEALSQDKISEAIADISNQMVTALVPSIDELSRSGEEATQTLQRLGADFQVLEEALVLAGQSAEEARAGVQSLSFGERSDLTDRFGGAGGLEGQLQSFFNDVLSESQQLEIVKSRVQDVLDTLGLDFIPTTEQLAEAYRTGTAETKALVLEHDDLIVTYQTLSESVEAAKKPLEDLGKTVKDIGRESNFTADDFKDMMRVIADERRGFTAGRREAQAGGLAPPIAITIGGRLYSEEQIRQQQQQAVDLSTNRLQQLAAEQLTRLEAAREVIRGQLDNVRETSNFFKQFREDALGIAGTNIIAARQQVAASAALARAGASIELIDTPELAQAVEALKQDRSQFFSTRKEFEQDRVRSASELQDLSMSGTDNARKQIDLLTEQLNVLEETLGVQQQQLQQTLNPDDAGRLSDSELQQAIGETQRQLFISEFVQGNTRFNGAVQFPDPLNLANALEVFRRSRGAPVTSVEDPATAELRKEISALRDEVASGAQAQNDLFNFMRALAPDGNALRTVGV